MHSYPKGQCMSRAHRSLHSSALIFEVVAIFVSIFLRSHTFLHPLGTHLNPISQCASLKHLSVQFLCERLGIWGTMCDFIGVTDGFTVGPDFFALKDLQTLLQPFRIQRENEPHCRLLSHSF